MLAGKREERYSDWLALALSTISDATTVLEILGESPDVQGKVSAVREFYMPEGHPERSGRLDIRLFVKESPLVDIEIKLGRAEHSDTGKQEGYSKWGAKKRILVALCGDKPKYEGDFRLLRWRDYASGYGVTRRIWSELSAKIALHPLSKRLSSFASLGPQKRTF